MQVVGCEAIRVSARAEYAPNLITLNGSSGYNLLIETDRLAALPPWLRSYGGTGAWQSRVCP